MTDRRNDHCSRPRLALAALSLPLLLSVLSGERLAAASEPSQVIYVTSERAGAIAVVDGGSLQMIRAIPVDDRPHNLKVTKDGLLLIATQGSNAVSVLDPGKDPPTVDRIDIGAPPHDLAVAEDGRTAYVVSGQGLLVRLDPFSGRVLQSVELEGSPHNAIVSGETAWITDVSSRRLLLVDPSLRVDSLPISIVGHDLALRPASEELWVTPWNSTRLVIIDRNSQEETAHLQVGRDAAHKHIAFTVDGSEAWVTEPSSGSIFVVDARTRQVAERVQLGGHPHHVRFADGRAYVAVASNDLVVLDVRSRRIIGRSAVGSGVHDVEITQLVE